MTQYDDASANVATIGVNDVIERPSMVFGPDIWVGFFESCLANLIPYGVTYTNLWIALEPDGSVLLGDDGPDYELSRAVWYEGIVVDTANPLQTRPSPGFGVAALTHFASTLTVRTGGKIVEHVPLASATKRTLGTTAKNLLRIRPGRAIACQAEGHTTVRAGDPDGICVRSTSWLTGRMGSFAAGRGTVRVEIWEDGERPASVICYRRGIVDLIEEMNADLPATSGVMLFEGASAGLQCQLAMQLYRMGHPSRTCFVHGRKTDTPRSEERGIWEGIASALSIHKADAIGRHVEVGSWSLGYVASLIGIGEEVRMEQNWGGVVGDERVRRLLAECVAKGFLKKYSETTCYPGARHFSATELTAQLQREIS